MFPYIQKHSVNNYILMYTINKAYHLYVQCRAFNQGIYVVKIKCSLLKHTLQVSTKLGVTIERWINAHKKYQEMYREDIMITVLLRLQVINVNLMVKKLDRNISYKLFL